jgi:uncharacterized protein (DUF1697 family)
MVVNVAMLRGVNVGGRNRIKMPALADLFTALGHTDVVTYIQSGNVVFRSRSKSSTALVGAIEERIMRDLGVEVSVLIRSRDELAAVVQGNPFLRTKADPGRLHVTFLAELPDGHAVRALEEFDAGPDEVRVLGREVYLHCPNGYGNTKLNPALIERRLRAISTTRNWNTVTKLLDLAG